MEWAYAYNAGACLKSFTLEASTTVETCSSYHKYDCKRNTVTKTK